MRNSRSLLLADQLRLRTTITTDNGQLQTPASKLKSQVGQVSVPFIDDNVAEEAKYPLQYEAAAGICQEFVVCLGEAARSEVEGVGEEAT